MVGLGDGEGDGSVVVGEGDGLVVTGGTGTVTGGWGRTGRAAGVLAADADPEPAGAAAEDDAERGAVAAGSAAALGGTAGAATAGAAADEDGDDAGAPSTPISTTSR